VRTLAKEIKANFQVFSSSWPKGLQAAMKGLRASETTFQGSYARITSFQAWRTELLENMIGADALGFFLEAQNDALVSHVFAGMGTWRAALKSLRSCLENVLFCLYYKDHAVELQLWHSGKHRLGFRDLEKYFREHPSISGIEIGKQAIDDYVC
jgi:hypothetical protein